jgi:alkanesulfonate monooxygenase SsuD/methylene tetrahydromethanopterin reductase-like flavin-dependent oxidoreductase (luciferase family)
LRSSWPADPDARRSRPGPNILSCWRGAWPRPWQQPHPPAWLTVNSPESAQTAGERGYVIGSLDTGYVRIPAIYAAYRKGAAGKGREATRARLAYMAMVGVGRAKEEGFLHDHVGRFGHLLMMEQGGHVTHEDTVDNLTPVTT